MKNVFLAQYCVQKYCVWIGPNKKFNEKYCEEKKQIFVHYNIFLKSMY